LSEKPAATRRVAALRRIVLAVGVLTLLVQWALIVALPRGDFALHVGFSRRLLARTFLYEGGTEIPYTPAFAMAFLPFTPLPDHLGQVLAYPLGVVTLVVLMKCLERVTRGQPPSAALFWVQAVTLLLASRFVLRDLYDGGENLALTALCWGGFLLWLHRRDAWGGVAIGLAAALKLTPLVFIVFFALKRQGRLVFASLLTAALVTVAPALWLGPSLFARHMAVWSTNVSQGLFNGDPSRSVLGPQPVTNIALSPALARILVGAPKGGPEGGATGSPLRGLGMRPAAAGILIAFAILALAATVLLLARQPVDRRDDPRLMWEAAAFGVLGLLMSPITWRAHAVAAIPALYLLVRRGATGSPALATFLGAWVFFFLAMNETFAGRDLTRLLSAWGIFTALLLALLGATLWEARSARRATR
jgi:Glycosyltransferase family 87